MFTIAIDFDGTIVDDNFPFDETIKEYAKEVINRYYDMGCYISIWTCRCGWFVTDCERILNDNGIKFHAINHGNPIYSHGRKIYADCYIDDKSIPYFNWYNIFLNII
jgi:hydroxymethylpyrimidine pyrophosphatase-like HAD family hydrolase